MTRLSAGAWWQVPARQSPTGGSGRWVSMRPVRLLHPSRNDSIPQRGGHLIDVDGLLQGSLLVGRRDVPKHLGSREMRQRYIPMSSAFVLLTERALA